MGQFYTNSIETDEGLSQSNLVLLKNFSIFSNNDLFSNLDELTVSYKNTQNLTTHTLNTILPVKTFFNLPASYLSVFNNFRADFEDFNFINSETTSNDFDDTVYQYNNTLKNLQISNLLVLRNSVKSSIVTFNALRKVFRARFDEGRSHTSLPLFAQMYTSQPFIKDMPINYTGLLSKDNNTFYQNMFYKNTNFKV